jgi:hypothetical protein
MMKTLLTTLITACCLFAGQAYAANADCEAKAVDKNGKALAGAAKTSFMKKCSADATAASPAAASCDKAAADKKLAGAAKNSFMTKCVADGGPTAAAAAPAPDAACEKQADEKKLAGAARTSFVKKCSADAKK